jgi:hypothetical protein
MANKKPPPLLGATILLGGVVLAVRLPYCGSSTGKLFMPVGSATEMLVTPAAREFHRSASLTSDRI